MGGASVTVTQLDAELRALLDAPARAARFSQVTDSIRAAILAAADAVDAARGELGVLDGAAGDGDHGMTMSIGARNVRRRLAALPDDAPAPDLVRASAAAMGGVGGAIGPIYAAALGAIAAEHRRPRAVRPATWPAASAGRGGRRARDRPTRSRGSRRQDRARRPPPARSSRWPAQRRPGDPRRRRACRRPSRRPTTASRPRPGWSPGSAAPAGSASGVAASRCRRDARSPIIVRALVGAPRD